MSTETQGVPGSYVWCPEGSPVEIHLSVDVVDRLGPEIMKGFGAVPKRGAEVGGILLGSIERNAQTIVRVEDFELVACAYKRGPSFLLAEEDAEAFADAWAVWQRNESSARYAVGYFRSHTRDGPARLGAEDLEIMDQYFADPTQIALLVRPFATKPSLAGFLVRADGLFPDETQLEFPFRRHDLTGEEAPRRRPMAERKPRADSPAPEAPRGRSYPPLAPAAAPPSPALHVATPARLELTWLWTAISLGMLILGCLVGYWYASGFASKPATKEADFTLSLAISRSDENLTVRWNRDAAVLRPATKGVMEIEDGDSFQTVELDAAHLQSGSLIYKNSSDRVRLKLTVSLGPQLSLTEVQEWAK